MKEGARKGLSWPAPSFFARRKALSGVCCLCIGILLGKTLLLDGPERALMTLAASAVALFFLFRSAKTPVCAAGLALGLALCMLRLYGGELPPAGKWTIEGTVASRVEAGGGSAACLLDDVTVTAGDGAQYRLRGRLSCYFADAGERGIAYGERLLAAGSGYELRGQRNPGGENERVQLAQRGAHMRFYAADPPVLTAKASFSVQGAAIVAADALAARADLLFGAASPILRAVLLGDVDAMPQAWSDAMQRSGAAHVLAVSGLHVAMWFALLKRAVSHLHLSPGARLAALAALLCAYVLLTGLRDSAIRAAVMLAVLEGAHLARRKADPLTSLALAAGVILLFRPLDLFSAGFQLSFGAVLGLILTGPGRFGRKNRSRLAAVCGGLHTTLSAQLGALAPVASTFGMFSPVSLAVNLLVIPLAGVLLPFGAAALFLSFVSPALAAVPAILARGVAAMMLLIATAGARLPVLSIPSFAPWTAAALYASLILASSAVVWSRRQRLSAVAALCALCFACGAVFSGPQTFYEQLDVGESLCGVLQTGGRRYVYDCGEDGRELSRYLRRQAGGVEAVFISHPHADHFSGLKTLLEDGVEIGTICVPAHAGIFGKDAEYDTLLNSAEKAGIRVLALSAGDVLHAEGVRVEVLAPEEGGAAGSGPNDRSLVLLVETGGWRLLLTGDADGATEPHGVPCDILQVAHHGSREASNKKALEGMSPRAAVISCGESRYHPAQETVERLQSAGAEVYATRASGAVRIALYEDRLEVREFCR